MVSRLYAEVVSDIGNIRFGRMPVHWGAGMIFNVGTYPLNLSEIQRSHSIWQSI